MSTIALAHCRINPCLRAKPSTIRSAAGNEKCGANMQEQPKSYWAASVAARLTKQCLL